MVFLRFETKEKLREKPGYFSVLCEDGESFINLSSKRVSIDVEKKEIDIFGDVYKLEDTGDEIKKRLAFAAPWAEQRVCLVEVS